VPARSGPAVPADEEAARLVPAVQELARRARVPVTADTFRVEVARRALDAGAAAINDISGGSDPEMLDLVAERGCGYVLMHIEGPPRVDREPAGHRDPVAHLKRWFGERIQAARARGVAKEQIALDPGLDFDLSVDDDLEILRRLGEFRDLGRPLFVALSRKDFLGAVLAGCRAVPFTDLTDITDSDAARALCLWVNSPGNPTGDLADLGAALRFPFELVAPGPLLYAEISAPDLRFAALVVAALAAFIVTSLGLRRPAGAHLQFRHRRARDRPAPRRRRARARSHHHAALVGGDGERGARGRRAAGVRRYRPAHAEHRPRSDRKRHNAGDPGDHPGRPCRASGGPRPSLRHRQKA